MTKEEVIEILKKRNELDDFLIDKAEEVWNIYDYAKSFVMREETGVQYAMRKYTYERIEYDETREQAYVVFENWCCGDTDQIDLPLDYFYDDNLTYTLLTKFRQEIADRKAKEQQEKLIKQEQYKSHDIETLKKLANKYPEVIDALQRDISNPSISREQQ